MIPHRLTNVLRCNNDVNLFDNLEILKGQTMADYIISNPSVLKYKIDTTKIQCYCN